MSTELQVIETIAAIIDTMTIANGMPFDCVHYKGAMNGKIGDNGTLLISDGATPEGVVQIAIDVGDGTNNEQFTETLTKDIPLTLYCYYRIPTDCKIEEVGYEYQKAKAKIKNMITQRFRDPNVSGIDPLTCRISQLRYNNDGLTDGFEQQDKYTVAVWYEFTVTYSTAEDVYDS